MLAPPFTPEVARELQAKSVESRRRNREAKKLAEKIAPIDPAYKNQVARLNGQLARIEEMMEGINDGKELSFLANAHAKLFAAWQVLTGTANPGSRRVKGALYRQPTPRSQDVWQATDVKRQVTTDVTTQPYVMQETQQKP